MRTIVKNKLVFFIFTLILFICHRKSAADSDPDLRLGIDKSQSNNHRDGKQLRQSDDEGTQAAAQQSPIKKNKPIPRGILEFTTVLKMFQRKYRSYLKSRNATKTTENSLNTSKANDFKSTDVNYGINVHTDNRRSISNLSIHGTRKRRGQGQLQRHAIINTIQSGPINDRDYQIGFDERRRLKRESKDENKPSKSGNAEPSDRLSEGTQPENKGVKASDVADDKACKILLPCVVKDGRMQYESLGYCLHWANEEGALADEMRRICYDNDPEPQLLSSEFLKPAPMTHKTPESLNDGSGNIGFEIPERSIYRHSQFFDVDGVGDEYKDKDGFTGFEFLDWPGETLDAHTDRMTRAQPLLHENLGSVRPCMQVLEYAGKANKYLDYICNTDEGLDISAVGLTTTSTKSGSGAEEAKRPSCSRKKVTSDKEEEFDPIYNLRCNLAKNRDKEDSKCATWPVPDGKIYLASGNQSFLTNYIQPLLVSEDILRRLAQRPEEDPEDNEMPRFDSLPLHCNEMNSSDIRTVLDFAFASDRLILGMKCGVIIVKDINKEDKTYDVAYLRSTERTSGRPDEPAYHKFPYMITTVAATPCCTTNKVCRHLVPLVAVYAAFAAYYRYPDNKVSYLEDVKVIFVSLDNGDTFDQKVVSPSSTVINLMYWMYRKIPKWQIKDAHALEWINKLVVEIPVLGEEFDIPVDPISKYVLQSLHPAEDEELPDNEEDCYEIVSIASVSEENLLLVLCRYIQTKKRGGDGTYAIFTIPIRSNIPIIVADRRSKRKFTCKPMPRFGVHDNSSSIQPTLVRIPKSYSIFILGCEKTIYYSSNGGRTLFLTAFYYNDTTSKDNTSYFRSYENKYLTSYPLVAIDPHGKHVVFTFGKHFAYGVISSNQEMSMISGPILEKLPEPPKGSNATALNPTFVPYFDESKTMRIGVIYINLLKDSGHEFFVENYEGHHSIRLLDAHVSIHSHALPFYSESLDTVAGMAKYTIKPCATFGFQINTTAISMDVGESQTVRVKVRNNQKDLPLNVLLTHDKAANLNVTVPLGSVVDENDDLQHVLIHEWDIKLTAKPYVISRNTARVDAFFGASYSNMEEVTSHLIISTEPQLRCHVQPRGHVSVRFGCSKYMAVHEDERRPQCDKFRENFVYSIPEGHYDPDMANYWINERPKFYHLEGGTLKISYDYEMFGCPVQPYRLDEYIPDLRILPVGGNARTAEGEKFLGNFILIEIFGASGYSFSKQVRSENCTRDPQTMEKMAQEWKVRMEAIKSAWYGYSNFDFDAVFHPLNIWNRVNYQDCHGNQFINEDSEEDAGEEGSEGDEGGDLAEEILRSPYEVLTNAADEESKNKLMWDPHNRQQAYIFLAVAVDPYDSFCTYHTYFGVSLTVAKEEPDWILILIYISTLLFLILLVVAGYYFQHHHVYRKFYYQSMFNRLLTAAWNLSFRYENTASNAATKKAEKDTALKSQLEQFERERLQKGFD